MRRGVTLVELLVVILVMLMITAVTIPAIRPALEGRKIREAARMVEVFLNGARNRAIATGKTVGVLIEPDPAEPSQCVSLSYVQQPDPYAGDYQNSTVNILGNGGFGAWQVAPQLYKNPFTGVISYVPGSSAGDQVFSLNDIGWIQNLAPGDTFILGTDDTVKYRLYLGEPFMDLNGNGSFDPGEPFNDVDGSGLSQNGEPWGVGYTPPDPSYLDPLTGFFKQAIPPVSWGSQSAVVTYAYADMADAIKFMTPAGLAFDKTLTNTHCLPIYYGPSFAATGGPTVIGPGGIPTPTTNVYASIGLPTHLSIDKNNNGSVAGDVAFLFDRRPIPSSSAKLNLPDSTCIDLGCNYIDPTTKNIVGVPGSGLDVVIPFSSGSSTLGNYASFRPNPLMDHEVVGNAASTLVNRPIMITFDPSGIVDKVLSFDERHFIPDATAASLAKPINFTDYQGRLATSPIYLLIGQQELVDGSPELLPTLAAGTAPLKPIFNMQDPTSLWVSINPRTGLISTTENVPVDLTAAPPTTQTAASPQIQLYFNAQAYQARSIAREASDMGGM